MFEEREEERELGGVGRDMFILLASSDCGWEAEIICSL